MKKKKLYLILTILVLVVFFSMALTCWEFFGRERNEFNAGISSDEAEEAEQAALLEEARVKAAEYEAAKEEEEEAPAEEVVEEAGVAEEERSFPNEPITYSGNIDMVTVILIVNFKTTEVTGSLSFGGDNINTYVDATIMDGKINIDTFEITTNYSGVTGSKGEGFDPVEFPINGTITGIITDDLSTFNGEMSSEEGAQKFTATRDNI